MEKSRVVKIRKDREKSAAGASAARRARDAAGGAGTPVIETEELFGVEM